MKIRFGFKRRSVLITSLLACLAFVCMAIVGWDLPVDLAVKFLVLSVALLLSIIVAAFVTVWVIQRLKRLMS